MHCQSLYELEGNATPREFGKWIVIVRTLGIKDSRSRGEDCIGGMMVAYDEVDAQTSRIRNLCYRLDTGIDR